MGPIEIIISYWLIIAALGMFFTLRKLGKARRGIGADGELNAAQHYQARWRLRSAIEAVAVATLFGASLVVALVDRALTDYSLGGLTTFLVSSAFTVWVIKQGDDDRHQDILADMIATQPVAEPRRHMDEAPPMNAPSASSSTEDN